MYIDTSIGIAITSAVIAGLALVWAIYTHISSRKVAKLTYKVSQLSDFGVPESFLVDMPRAPLAITVTSGGNKSTENIILRLKTKSHIENFEVSPSGLPVDSNDNELLMNIEKLNPSQQVKLFLRCTGPAHQDQISELDLSHSEGAGINVQEMRKIAFKFLGVDMEYDTRALAAQITRIGPFRFLP